MTVMFVGGTDLAVAATRLADDLAPGSWLEPARAWFEHDEDANAFDDLLSEAGIKFMREPRKK